MSTTGTAPGAGEIASQAGRLITRPSIWWALLCSSAPLIAFWAVCPLLDMGFNDDWVYIRMAERLARTGKITYDGFTQSMAVPLAIWGAAVIRTLGFSFLLLRASVVPFWAACGWIVYLLGRRIGLHAAWAGLASLSASVSVVATPAAACFATDIPSLSLMLLSVYCGMRALERGSGRITIGWLAAAGVAGGLAGAIRDVYWCVPVWTIMVVVLLRWRERRVRVLGLLLSAATLAVGFCAEQWHYSQSNAPHAGKGPYWRDFPHVTFTGLGLCATAALLCLPVLVGMLPCITKLRRWPRALFLSLMAASGLAAFAIPNRCMAPWIGNLFTRYGAFQANQVLIGDRPDVIPSAVRFTLGLTVFASVAVCAGAALQVAPSFLRRVRDDLARQQGLVPLALMAVPFAAGYIALLAIRNVSVFDRYMLPVAALGAPLLAVIAQGIERRPPGIYAWMALALLAFLGIANTHDQYAMHRATLQAAEWLTGRWIPRTRITAGYEYDGWTQLEEKGDLSETRRPMAPVPFWFYNRTGSVQPCWYVMSSARSDLGAITQAVPYNVWLPPKHRSIVIQQAGESSFGCR